MLPSPTAAATRLTGPRRTSPHAKIPGIASFEKVRIAGLGDQRPLLITSSPCREYIAAMVAGDFRRQATHKVFGVARRWKDE